MAVKKAFQEVVAFLESNENSKVKTILPDVIQMCSAKSGGGSGGQMFIKNAAGETTHIFCYYHKKWEDVSKVEFGAKSTSPTGLSNMCKEGTAAWTKQNRDAKKAEAALLDQVANGEVDPADIAGLRADIITNSKTITPREDGQGSDERPAD